MFHHFPYPDFAPLEIPDPLIAGCYCLPDYALTQTDTELIQHALAHPIAARPVSQEVRPGMKIAIAVDDNSRNTKVHLMLPLVLQELQTAKIPTRDIAIVIALGTHRRMRSDEIIEKYTRPIAEKYRFVNLDWRDAEGFGTPPNLSSTFPIRIYREILDADYVIGIGQTIPHMIAGFGGGGKIINPGCADGETIGYMHWLCRQAAEGCLFAVRDNPVRQVIDEVGIQAGLKFIVNEVPASQGRIGKVFAGHPLEAHRQACGFAKEVCLVKLKEKTDIVVADAYPADLDFWQALKGLNAAYGAVKKGGTVILVTPCPEGACSQHPEVTRIGYIPVDKIEKMVQAGQLDKAVAANLFLGRQLLDYADTILVTKGISQADTQRMGLGWASDPRQALCDARAKYGDKARINVLYKASKMICTL